MLTEGRGARVVCGSGEFLNLDSAINATRAELVNDFRRVRIPWFDSR